MTSTTVQKLLMENSGGTKREGGWEKLSLGNRYKMGTEGPFESAEIKNKDWGGGGVEELNGGGGGAKVLESDGLAPLGTMLGTEHAGEV